MSNYVKATNFAVKDSLLSGNPAKLVKGTEIDTEFNAIASAIATKFDTDGGTLTLNTLTLGTQTNKATLSYTTNTARTLTVPAVAGNRTFAFIDEAQTFSTTQTLAANLVFSGNARRIQGKFDNYDNDSVIIQDSVTNSTTTVNIAPNGTGNASSLHLHAGSDLTDSVVGAINITETQVNFFSAYQGSKSYQPLNLVNGGAIYTQVNSDGTVYMPGVYDDTVGATNRDLYIDNTGKLGYLSSTRKSKTNIEPIADSSWLMQLEPVSFNRRIRASNGIYTDQTHKTKEFGLIADDVAQVKPELCFNDDFGNLAGIHYEQLIAPMLKEIQNLRAEVEALKAKGN